MADLQPPSEPPTNGGGVASEHLGPSLGSKRQRRPSVRLGDIGEPSAAAAISHEAYYRKNKQWRVSSHGHGHLLPREQMVGKAAAGASKTRPLTNIGNGESHETQDLIDEKNPSGGDFDSATAASGGALVGSRKVREPKQKRGSMGTFKRVRTNWVSRVDGGGEGEHEKLSGEGDMEVGVGGGDDEGFRGYDPEGSETPSKEHSPMPSTENAAMDLRPSYEKAHGSEKDGVFPRRGVRTSVLDSRDPDAVEIDVPSDVDGGDWRCRTSLEQNGGRERRFRLLDDGVQLWLDELGLGRYAQVFEIHEVDDEVLPLLTMEDLKDMGINAVGSRRKMYSSIQKLRKGFS